MNEVTAGTELPFEVTFDSPSLEVALKIMDVTAGVPGTLVGTVPMVNTINNTYGALYTPLVAGKKYITNKAVYTDNTYATRDPNYSEGSESFKTKDEPGIVQVLLAGEIVAEVETVEVTAIVTSVLDVSNC